MNQMPAPDGPEAQSAWDVPKKRPCLRCKSDFASQWSGERVCPRCKTSRAWKSGEQARAFSSRPSG